MLKTSTPWSFIASQQALISITDLGSVTKANSLSGVSDRTRRLTFPKAFSAILKPLWSFSAAALMYTEITLSS